MPEVGVVAEEVDLDVECSLFDKENEAGVAVDVGSCKGAGEVDVPHLALRGTWTESWWWGSGSVAIGHWLMLGIASAATVAAVVWKGVKFSGEAVSEAAPGVEAFESWMTKGCV